MQRRERYARSTPDDFEAMSKAAKSLILLAGGLGFEPRQAESESAVLPLDDPPILDRGRRLAGLGWRGALTSTFGPAQGFCMGHPERQQRSTRTRRRGCHRGPATASAKLGMAKSLSDHTERAHRFRHPGETRDICAQNVVARRSVFLGCLRAAIMNSMHDFGEPFFGRLEAPGIP